MEPLLILFGLAVLAYILFAPLVALLRAGDARRSAEEAQGRLAELRTQVRELQEQLERSERQARKSMRMSEEERTRAASQSPSQKNDQVITPEREIFASPPPVPAEPAHVLPTPSRAEQRPTATPPPLPEVTPQISTTTPIPNASVTQASIVRPKVPVAASPSANAPTFSLEQFLGVKLFAWVGGLALFMGVVFFVKYAFEHGWISPALRTTMGFVTGAALVTAGVWMRGSKAYAVLAQTLAATGVLVLYGVTYAAHELYHFQAFGPYSTFAYMSLITAVAFLLAVRMNGQVIAVLGMAGGFLTPFLVNTGRDNPWGLFGYITLLNLGLIAVTKARRWNYLMVCGAVGSAITEAGWFARFFAIGHYEFRVWVPITIHLFFPSLFAAATAWLKRRDDTDTMHAAVGGLLLAAWSTIVAFVFLGEPEIASRPWVLNGFLFAINGLVLWQIWLQPKLAAAQWLAALATFVHLAIWSGETLTTANLPAALISYLIFGGMHTAFALAALRLRPGAMAAQRHGIWLGPVAALLVMIPIFALPSIPWMIWPAILMLNLMTIAVALITLSLAPVLLALFVSLTAVGIFLFRLPLDGSGLFSFLIVLGGLALVFAAASAVLTKRLFDRAGAKPLSGEEWLTSLQGLLPISAAGLPFALLILALERLHLTDPSPIFGFGLLLSAMLLSLMRMAKIPALGVAALVCMTALEYTWFLNGHHVQPEWKMLVWHLGIASAFALYPFVWHRHLRNLEMPWNASAVAWLLHFPLVYEIVDRAYHMRLMGLVPAAFALPSLASLAFVIKMPHADSARVRNSQIAWFGGMALFFITLIFPIQFDHQWITVSWALEGAALCWLYTRVPHEGLRKLGVALLTTTFVRLALNPAVLAYEAHSDTPLWNWFLYTYGIVAIAQCAAAVWLAPPRHRMGGSDVRMMLWTFGVILTFLLVNIEIADFYTPKGSSFLVFNLGGNFARDMVYSIAWALFALALLILGFWKRVKGVRYAGIALMGVTLVKLFFNDLANIGSIYRIGALLVVAVIALGASFLYQRYYSTEENP